MNRIEIARGEMAMQWEKRLMEEMTRLKMELEQMYAEDRHSELEKLKQETEEETARLTNIFKARESQLVAEVSTYLPSMRSEAPSYDSFCFLRLIR